MNAAFSMASLPRGVWRAGSLPPAAGGTVASGHALLDAELPGGGWPLGALIDVALADARTPWSALLLPALAGQAAAQSGVVVIIQPPHEPYLPALAAAGLRPERVLWLRADTSPGQSWLAGQALGCADVATVLAWLPGARPTDLRRLHWAAARRAEVLFFALRQDAGAPAACAPLGLALDCARGGPGDATRLLVEIRKRRGPPLAAALELPAFSPRLMALLAAGRRRQPATVLPFPAHVCSHAPGNEGHALDRTALAV